MLRISDFIKIINLNYFFHPDMLEKKPTVSSFVVLGDLTDLCLTWTWFLMISGNRHLSVKEFGSRSDRRLTQVYAPS